MGHPDIETEKIEITDYFPLKHSSKKYYITLPKQLIHLHGLITGDFLKITIVEARRMVKDEEP